MEAKKKFIINTLFYGIVCVLVVGFGKYILPILSPFVVAFCVAWIIHAIVKKINLKSLKLKKILGVFLCAGFYSILFILVAVFGYKLFDGAGSLIESIPRLYEENIVPLLTKISEQLEVFVFSIDASASQKINNAFAEVLQSLAKFVSDFSVNAIKWVADIAKGVPGSIVKLVITIVATFFMTADWDRMMCALIKLLPTDKQKTVTKGIEYIRSIIGLYLKSYFLLFVLTFIELSIGFWVLKIPYGVVLALLIAFFDILPALGTGGVLLPWGVVLLIMGDYPLAIGLIVLYIVITVIRNVAEPRIIGKQIGLHPLITLIAMFFGLQLFGVIGMIGVPVVLAVIFNLEKDGIIQLKRNAN